MIVRLVFDDRAVDGVEKGRYLTWRIEVGFDILTDNLAEDGKGKQKRCKGENKYPLSCGIRVGHCAL